jgi:RimJ/RimL family protein N-acetyltransferase
LRHDIHIDGHVYRLRPVTESDAAFILDLRQRAGRYLNRGASTLNAQIMWLQRYFERHDDLYFVVEAKDDMRRQGLIGLYDLDRMSGTGQWGRWVVQPDSNAAVESALLIYRCAFETLSLNRVFCRTLVDNGQVVAFHDSCGLKRAAAPVFIDHNGQCSAAVEHSLTRPDWPEVRGRLDRLAARWAVTVRRGT